MTIKHVLLTSLTLLATACVSHSPAPAPPAAPVVVAPVDPTNEVEIKQTFDATMTATGRRAAIKFAQGTGLIGDARRATFVTALEDLLKTKGFTITKDPAQAHVYVVVAAYHQEAVTKDAPPATWGLKVAAFINAHGRRPRPWFTETAEVRVSLAQVWDEFSERALAGVNVLEVKAPAQDQRMKGPPGCVPRFGFDSEWTSDGAKRVHKVTRVTPKSPAARAGMRVGDVIEAIDSLDYEMFGRDDREVYESRIPVPVRLNRNGQVIRGTLRAEVGCAN